LATQSLYLEHFQLHQSPFRQEPDPEIFFAQAGRDEVLTNLLTDVESGKPLLKLTGSEGVGKTLLYLLLAQRLPPQTYDLVCLDHPVGSFEDLLRIICHALGKETNSEVAGQQSYLLEFREQLKLRQARQVRVVLVIDEAEKVFLATLERLMRLICDTEEGNVLQILLVGRPELDKNLEQLAIYCSTIDVNAGYVLEPLTFPETEMYLQYRLKMAGAQGDKALATFSKDASQAIYQQSGGNISLINMIAENALVMASDAGMFTVEAELFSPQQKKERDILMLLHGAVSWAGKYKRWALSGAAILLVLLLVALWPEKKGGAPMQSIEAPSPVEKVARDALVIDILPPTMEKETPPAETTETMSAPEPDPVIEFQEEQEARKPVVEQQEGREDAKPAVVEQAEIKLSPDGPPAEQKATPILQPGSRKIKGKDAQSTLTDLSAQDNRNPDELFQERLRASSNWLAWSYRGGFTIQLMVLASDSAEENLKSLLVQDEYFAIRENLYILRKSSPPTVIVFYGLYDTIEEARRVRNDLPVFLRKNQPYALSINDALNKTEE